MQEEQKPPLPGALESPLKSDFRTHSLLQALSYSITMIAKRFTAWAAAITVLETALVSILHLEVCGFDDPPCDLCRYNKELRVPAIIAYPSVESPHSHRHCCPPGLVFDAGRLPDVHDRPSPQAMRHRETVESGGDCKGFRLGGATVDVWLATGIRTLLVLGNVLWCHFRTERLYRTQRRRMRIGWIAITGMGLGARARWL